MASRLGAGARMVDTGIRARARARDYKIGFESALRSIPEQQGKGVSNIHYGLYRAIDGNGLMQVRRFRLNTLKRNEAKGELMTSSRVWVAAAVFAGAIAGNPAYAHHSAAMFDANKTVTITGAVKDYKWANPHAMIEVLAAGDKGAQTVWNIECSTPNILVRKGWSINSLKVGDTVTIQAHPMRDGTQAGLLMTVSTAGGATLKDHDY